MSDHKVEDDPVDGLVKEEVDEDVFDDGAVAQVKAEVKTEAEVVSGEKTLITMAIAKSNEPPAFISERKSYAEYKTYLKMWSRITTIPKKDQAEVVVYSLGGHP